jgi:hypothetical protein
MFASMALLIKFPSTIVNKNATKGRALSKRYRIDSFLPFNENKNRVMGSFPDGFKVIVVIINDLLV